MSTTTQQSLPGFRTVETFAAGPYTVAVHESERLASLAGRGDRFVISVDLKLRRCDAHCGSDVWGGGQKTATVREARALAEGLSAVHATLTRCEQTADKVAVAQQRKHLEQLLAKYQHNYTDKFP